MERLGSISSTISVPRLLVGALLAVGIFVLGYAFTQHGVMAGLIVAAIPATLCFLWITLRYPPVAMFSMFVANYFIMTLSRYLFDQPFGVILDALIFYNILLLALHAILHNIEWGRAWSGLTLAAAIWVVYCILELVNPEVISLQGWVMAFRSMAMQFLLVVVLTQIVLAEYKYLKYMLAIWSVLTLIAVGKAFIQKTFGFSGPENYWLFVMGGHTTHIIHTGIRYFSFFSDAANFGGSMGMSMVVFSISALYVRNSWMRFYLLVVAAAACYGMLISGTRSALAVPFMGYVVFVLLSRNYKFAILGFFCLVSAFVFLNFTTIGQGNAIIRRTRSAFNTQDASFQVRLRNQETLRTLMVDKPFGAGLGHSGGKAKSFAPHSTFANIAPDSWFVMIWVETGVVGILIHLSILLYIVFWGSYQVFFRLRHPQVRGFTIALIAGIVGIMAMSYANEVLGQIPTGVIMYMSMAFVFLSLRFDREMLDKEALTTNIQP